MSTCGPAAESLPEPKPETTAVTSFLGRAHGTERKRRALELLAHSTGCGAGFLYEAGDDGVSCVTGLEQGEPPQLLKAAVTQFIAERAAPACLLVELASNDNELWSQRAAQQPTRFHLILLDSQPALTAIALGEEEAIESERDLIGDARRCFGP